jgi:hypothetical protein
MTIIAPKGWAAGKIEHRFSSSAPLSYNAAEHSCECIISAGAAVARVYGTEVLEISRAAVDLSRIPVPLLDSHSQGSVIESVVGRIDSAWVSGGKLYGEIIFAQTPRGKLVEGMIARKEISGISAGYSVSKWDVRDIDGEQIDEDHVGWDDNLTFTAKRWMLYEASCVGVPADTQAAIRSLGNEQGPAHDARVRMEVRSRMAQRQRMHDLGRAMFDN